MANQHRTTMMSRTMAVMIKVVIVVTYHPSA
jgi:hypothetical protein